MGSQAQGHACLPDGNGPGGDANKPLLAQKGSAAPPSPAMPSASNQDARAVWARRGTAWRLVVLWSAHPCGMTRKVKCLSESFKPFKRRTNVLKVHAFFLSRGHFPRAAGAGPAVRCKRRVLLCGTLPCLAWPPSHCAAACKMRVVFVLRLLYARCQVADAQSLWYRAAAIASSVAHRSEC